MNIDTIMAGAMDARAAAANDCMGMGLALPMPMLMPSALLRLRWGRKGSKEREISLVLLPMRKEMEIRKGQRSGTLSKPKGAALRKS